MLIEMTIKGLMVDPVTNMPIVILKDKDGDRVLPIWVGIFEANAIALQIENVATPRPMTHDLLRNIITDLEGQVDRVVVCDLKDNTFYALIHLRLNGQAITKFVYPLFADIIVPSSKVGLPDSLRRLDRNNFAPRFGIAWRPTGENLVVRAGYGVFNGLMEAVGGLRYELRTERTGPIGPHVVAGPSCDSMDVIASGVDLPDLDVGDRVYVMNAGAYTLSYASSFNGFPPPRLYVLMTESRALP